MIEKDVKITFEGSPSAKGSLENFLVTSKETNNPPLTSSDSPSRRASVKRNLNLEITSSSKHEKKEPLFAVKKNSETLDDDGGATAGGHKDSSENEEAAEVGNSELKQFATKFLSLYCRYYIYSSGDLIFLVSILVILNVIMTLELVYLFYLQLLAILRYGSFLF